MLEYRLFQCNREILNDHAPAMASRSEDGKGLGDNSGPIPWLLLISG